MTNTYEKLEISEGTVDFIADVCREIYGLKWMHVESLLDDIEGEGLSGEEYDIIKSLADNARQIHTYWKNKKYDIIANELESLIDGVSVR